MVIGIGHGDRVGHQGGGHAARTAAKGMIEQTF
jgi:hypothetical protein